MDESNATQLILSVLIHTPFMSVKYKKDLPKYYM